jgi:hypothetical protein
LNVYGAAQDEYKERSYISWLRCVLRSNFPM